MSTTLEEFQDIINIVSKYANLTSEDEKKIGKILSSINTRFLYNSKIHGLYHSQKVLLFSYLIAKHENLSDVDCQIIFDAALYHDIGRINDYEDSLHGYASALRINNVVNHPIYKDEENIKILKAIVDGHSVSDENKMRFIDDYEIAEVERYNKLYDILKDADALDRKRFYDTSHAYLDERFLRLDISKKLISLSEEINAMYHQKIVGTKKVQPKGEIGDFTCFHSVGFDFFKIKSIIEHGILSKNEMKKRGISNAANFEGGNLDDYVSVVDARMLNKGGTAFPTFIANGVSFVCKVNKLYSSDANHTMSYCIENGLPYNKSFHADEKYVYSQIEPDNIKSVFLHKDIINKDVRELNYIYNSLSYKLLFNRINHYFDNISDTFKPDTTHINLLLSEYKKALEDYYILDSSEKSRIRNQFINKLESIRIKINAIIQEWMYQKFQIELGKKPYERITVEEVVTHELQKLGLEYEKAIIDNGYLYSYQKIMIKSK